MLAPLHVLVLGSRNYWSVRMGARFCEINGTCVTSGDDYGSNEHCVVEAQVDLFATATRYHVNQFDALTLNGTEYTEPGPQSVFIAAGDSMEWSSCAHSSPSYSYPSAAQQMTALCRAQICRARATAAGRFAPRRKPHRHRHRFLPPHSGELKKVCAPCAPAPLHGHAIALAKTNILTNTHTHTHINKQTT